MLKNSRLFAMKPVSLAKNSEQESIQQTGTALPTFQKTHTLPTSVQHTTQAAIHTIQAREHESPFFLLHGNWTGGVPFYCYTVARTMGHKQPFYALDPYIFNGPCKPMSIEEMATEHLKSLRAIQPEGPYLLGGFCNGSLIAYEMARQLQEQGQTIDLLILITPTHVSRLRQGVVRSMHFISSALHIQPMQQLSWFLRFRHAIRHVYRMFHTADTLKIQDFPKLVAIDPRLDTMLPPTEALFNDYVGIFTWMAALYKKRFMPDTISFIWASKELANRKAWAAIEKETDSPIIIGHHMQCVTEHSGLLAEELKTQLQKYKDRKKP